MLGSLALPGLLLIGIVALAPIAWLFWLSFRDADGMTLAHYARLLHPSYLDHAWQSTFELSFLVTIICILLGYPLAYVIAQARSRVAALLLLLVLFPIWTSLLVRCYAWLVLLQRRGLINTWLSDLGLIDRPAAARAQLHRHDNRHGAHHAALHGAAALRLDACHQSRLHARRSQSRARRR